MQVWLDFILVTHFIKIQYFIPQSTSRTFRSKKHTWKSATTHTEHTFNNNNTESAHTLSSARLYTKVQKVSFGQGESTRKSTASTSGAARRRRPHQESVHVCQQPATKRASGLFRRRCSWAAPRRSWACDSCACGRRCDRSGQLGSRHRRHLRAAAWAAAGRAGRVGAHRAAPADGASSAAAPRWRSTRPLWQRERQSMPRRRRLKRPGTAAPPAPTRPRPATSAARGTCVPRRRPLHHQHPDSMDTASLSRPSRRPSPQPPEKKENIISNVAKKMGGS